VQTSTFVDSNVLIDVWGPPGTASEWSASALTICHSDGPLVINAIVWSELGPLVKAEASLQAASAKLGFEQESIPWGAAFLAGVAHSRYRKAGGTRECTLPDFLIGAHASVARHRLLTRDASRYRSYFPDLEIIAPDTHP
jgi:predicted nucleic acid-binding protein